MSPAPAPFSTLSLHDALPIFAVARNLSKSPVFTSDERVRLVKEVVAGEPRIEVQSLDGLLVDFARSVNARLLDRKSTRLNSSHVSISYAVFCLKKKTNLVI